MNATTDRAIKMLLLYLIWFASCALVYPVFLFVPNAVRTVAAALGADQWVIPAVHRFTIFGMLIPTVIFVIWTEVIYSRAIKIGFGKLLRAFVWVTVGQLALVAIAFSVSRILP